EEIRRTRAEEDRELDEEEDEAYYAIGVFCLLSEQKLTASLQMLTYEASADQVDEIARMSKSTILECLVRFCNAKETLYTKDYRRKPTPRNL
ncbi:unnamed protein product, partial [Prunus brigantina]